MSVVHWPIPEACCGDVMSVCWSRCSSNSFPDMRMWCSFNIFVRSSYNVPFLYTNQRLVANLRVVKSQSAVRLGPAHSHLRLWFTCQCQPFLTGPSNPCQDSFGSKRAVWMFSTSFTFSILTECVWKRETADTEIHTEESRRLTKATC